MDVPPYLAERAATFEQDPRQAAMEWFEDARYGLFLHYGLYSLLGNHEWVQYRDQIPPHEYALLQDYFTAEAFDAEAIVELAQDAGMNYVNITTKHHDGFCLFETDQTTFNSVEAPANRDLVGELADACEAAGLGLFFYYSVGLDWHHPHAPNRSDWSEPARPAYDRQPGNYADAGHDLDQYLEYVRAQVTELLTNYGSVAGIWFDPGVFSPLPDKWNWDPEPFDFPALYDHIRELQPQTLISYKDGVTGTEDFVAPEVYYENSGNEFGKLGEMCACMLPSEEYEDEIEPSWGYMKAARGKHKSAEEVWNHLEEAADANYNLLLNTGPLPNGALDPEDTEPLREAGDRLKREGFPSE